MATFDVGILFTAVNQTKGAFRSINADMEKTAKTSQVAANKLRAIQVVLAGIAIGAAVQFSKSIVKNVADMELLIERLARVEGGYGAARDTVAKLTKEFGKTPFAIDAVANGFTRLRAAGLSTEDSWKTVRAGVDAVAAFGGSTVELNRYIIGVQQSIGKGTLSMEEFRQQIGEAVPSAMRVLAREMNVSIGELFRRIETGAVNSKEAIELLSTGLQKDFAGAAAATADKITGALQGLSSSIRVSLEEAFNVNTSAGRRTVELINKIASALNGLIKSFSGEDVGRVFSALDHIINALGVIGSIAGPSLRILADSFNGVSSVIERTGGLISSMASPIINLGRVFGATSQGMSDVTNNLISTLGSGAAYGLIGRLVFGLSGPAAIVAAIAGISISFIGKASASFENIKSFYADYEKNIVKYLAGGGVKEAIAFLEKEEKLLLSVGTSAKIAGGGFGIVADSLEKVRSVLKDLRSGTGSITSSVIANSDEMKKGLESITDYVDRGFSTAVTKLEALNDRIKTTTFNFGSNVGDRMRQQIKALEPVIKGLESRIAAAPSREGMTEEQRKTYDAAVASAKDFRKRLNDAISGISAGEEKGRDIAMDRVNDALEKARINVSKFAADIRGGNGMEAAVQAINDKYDSMVISIENILEKQKLLNDTSGMAATNALLEEANRIRGELVAKMIEQKKLEEDIKNIQLQASINQIKKQTADVKRSMDPMSGMFGDDLNIQAENRKFELSQQNLDLQVQIQKAHNDSLYLSGKDLDLTNQKIEALFRLKDANDEAIKSTSAASIAATQLWTGVGNAIENSTKGALKDLIKGSFDAKKTLLSFYDAITDAVVEYIAQLIKAYIRQQMIGAATGGAGGGFMGFLGGLFASANGNAFQGKIQPFAEGGIIRGPTMFGLAGEAGTEAIMPLTRIGGELGVKTSGGGGDNYHITISAIDTQSGASFLMKHSDQIVMQMRQQTRLNNGMGVK